MSTRIGDKTPAQLHNDLLFLNNGNLGVDTLLRSLFSGNGLQLPIKIAQEQIEIDFGEGLLRRPLAHSYRLFSNDAGNQSGTYQISTTAGNLQKIRLTGNLSLTLLSDIGEDMGFELTLLIEQSVGGHVLTLPSAFKTTAHAPITFSPNAGAIDILKIVTFDGGLTWLAYKVASDLR